MKLGRTIVVFMCLIVSVFACCSLSSCKNKDGLSKTQPNYNEALELCKQEIEKDGECFYVIEQVSYKLDNVEPNTYYFWVHYLASGAGKTPKDYLVTISYAKNDKKYYEPKVEKQLVY